MLGLQAGDTSLSCNLCAWDRSPIEPDELARRNWQQEGGSRETKLQNQNTKPSKTKELQDAAIKALSLREKGEPVPWARCLERCRLPSASAIPTHRGNNVPELVHRIQSGRYPEGFQMGHRGMSAAQTFALITGLAVLPTHHIVLIPMHIKMKTNKYEFLPIFHSARRSTAIHYFRRNSSMATSRWSPVEDRSTVSYSNKSLFTKFPARLDAYGKEIYSQTDSPDTSVRVAISNTKTCVSRTQDKFLHHDRHAWGLLPSAPKTCPPTPCTCLPVLTMHEKAASNCGNRGVEEALSTADPMLNRFNADCQAEPHTKQGNAAPRPPVRALNTQPHQAGDAIPDDTAAPPHLHLLQLPSSFKTNSASAHNMREPGEENKETICAEDLSLKIRAVSDDFFHSKQSYKTKCLRGTIMKWSGCVTTTRRVKTSISLLEKNEGLLRGRILPTVLSQIPWGMLNGTRCPKSQPAILDQTIFKLRICKLKTFAYKVQCSKGIIFTVIASTQTRGSVLHSYRLDKI
ncbi:hypothetical protein Anapl_06706 [Anas platyrhynchos]|uniref:Uncharacterized protein n=1 Tax=Anas platyrhynchos TaxID=8839 RepID=R0LY60_ANAPL|nr:hypothetical protein Anapl_06706 [Anas platyrhynchos]